MIVSCLLCMTYLLTFFSIFPNTRTPHVSTFSQGSSYPTSLEHVVFGIASNEKSWSSRKNYVRLWWRPNETRGCIFLENAPPNTTTVDRDDLPPVCVSKDTSRFRYTYRNGLRSAVRVARVVSETVSLNHSNVRWFVFGDDDTVFFPENLVKTLSKYGHGLWYYIGTNSESFAQNKIFSYEMAFGGAGFAISYPLAKVLAKVFDSCLDRYPHLYGSDGRIHACLAELGVSLTHEPGFHQMDIRGSMFGFLASHPVSPLVTLHHWEAMEPIFPKMTPIKALEHLFQAVNIDSQRIMQQTVCYDRWFSWTISVSWATPFKFSHTMPVVFFFQNASSGKDGITSTYRMMSSENCTFDRASPRKLEEIRVFSHKLELDNKQIQAPRRHCCDVLPSKADTLMEIAIRECGDEELIYIH
ncbi:hypothetical protein DH2020_011511 [Rehmannia glutinosa]|uniref:Transferring glycosyl group transferase n=1 Tax=Rehmannia glutinosa TaxID=99300 RepID=A0ABR0XDK3_REHGL